MKIEWDSSMTKKALTYIASGAGILLVYFLLSNFGEVKKLWGTAVDILRPFTFGLIFAYLLKVWHNVKVLASHMFLHSMCCNIWLKYMKKIQSQRDMEFEKGGEF